MFTFSVLLFFRFCVEFATLLYIFAFYVRLLCDCILNVRACVVFAF